MSNLLELLDHSSGRTENQHIFVIRQLKLGRDEHPHERVFESMSEIADVYS
jgi:hypothetical protein